MQLRYVASELGTGLKRNVSMTIAVILTIWMSLTLVGLGLLVRSQVTKIEQYFGSQLEVQVVFCGQNSQTDTCVGGQASPTQEVAVRKVITASPEVASYRFQTRQQAYRTFQATHTDDQGHPSPIAKILKVSDMSTGYWVKFKDPNQTQALISSVNHQPGVEQIIDIRKELDPVYRTLNMLKWMALGAAGLLVLAAVLQVSNTIRLAAMARRREIGIMRLVGASSVYIQLPFVLEVIFSALVGAALACATLAVVVKWFVPWLHRVVQLWQWVSWSTALWAMVWMVAIALALAIVPTVVMTRKYLRV
ncbi:MAG: cell division transport system permease protein [Nocardioidaceae bacterium]|jgi:cell division transport system permease protein|nr:cell division transport system permease protein [Nocardioidaceae bacterium]MDX6308983.1 cell division transport system permease protein [Nocardioidaceae bacterium]